MKTRGKAEWAFVNNLDKTYGQWKVNLYMDKEEAQKLKAIGIKVKTIVDDKDDSISYRYTFVRKLKKRGKAAGQENIQPTCVDSQGNKFDGLIGNGSEVIVQHKPYNWSYTTDTGQVKSGTATDFCGIQIVDLIPYEAEGGNNDGITPIEDDDEEGFEPIAGGFVAKTAEAPAPKAPEKSTGDDLDF